MKKELWAAMINLSGLYSREPIRVVWNHMLKDYYAADGNFSVASAGLLQGPSLVTYAHANKDLVQAWIDGVRSSHHLLREWAR